MYIQEGIGYAMVLSTKALAICAEKYGKGSLCGFNEADLLTSKEDLEIDAEQVFNELLENELIIFTKDSVHISALGHHLLNMMLNPEQFIILENHFMKIIGRLYIRDAYYLCIIEYNGMDSLILNYLPKLNHVVSSFVYCLNPDNKSRPAPLEQNKNQAGFDICIKGKSWNDRKEIEAELNMLGNYHENRIIYQRKERMTDGNIKEGTGLECDLSAFINQLTEWLFDRLFEQRKRREEKYGNH